MQRLGARFYNVLSKIDYNDIRVLPYRRNGPVDVNTVIMSNVDVISKSTIESRAKTLESFTVSWKNGPTIIIHLMLTSMRPSLPIIVRRIVMGYALIHDGVHEQSDMEVEMYLIDLPDKKLLPLKAMETLTQSHVNGGSTWYKSDKKRVIVVYREEELLKVLVHEMVHSYNLDEHIIGNITKETENYLVTKRGIKTNGLKLHETYTDVIACLFHIACWTFDNLGPNADEALFISMYKEALQRAYAHMINTTAQIIRHFSGMENWSERTAVYSYYLCKAAVFKPFITKMSHRMQGWKLTGVKVKNFLELIVDSVDGQPFVADLEDSLRTPKIERSIRMTPVEFDRGRNP